MAPGLESWRRLSLTLWTRLPGSVFEVPVHITDLGQCSFYHTMDLPGYGTVDGAWDLRETASEYLGGVELEGKRVLELGKASGFLTFFMERRGAEVLAADLSERDSWDVVENIHRDWETWDQECRADMRRLNNSFWLARRALGSQARFVSGSVYDVPGKVKKRVGLVDVSTFCSILLHLRDPLLALKRAAAITREMMIVTDIAPDTYVRMGKHPEPDYDWFEKEPKGPYAKFIPDPMSERLDTWWHLSPELIARMLRILGFTEIMFSEAEHLFLRPEPMHIPLYTVVGRRRP